MVSHRISFSLSLSHQRQRPLKRKKRTSSLKTSSSDSSNLPDKCWESIFRFLITDDNHTANRRTLNSLSLVSKQFLSITNCFRFQLPVKEETCHFLPRLFIRFTNLTSLDLSRIKDDLGLDNLLRKISCFPSLNITSLKLPSPCTFPENGLRAFSQKITTLTSLNCSGMDLDYDDLLLIADCFPLLKELDLGYLSTARTDFMYGMPVLLSKCRCIQHLDLSNNHHLDDKLIAELSLFLSELVSINLSECDDLTESALFSLVKNCPSLTDINMEYTRIGVNDYLGEFGVYPQLKSLFLGRTINYINMERFTRKIISCFPNVQLFD